MKSFGSYSVLVFSAVLLVQDSHGQDTTIVPYELETSTAYELETSTVYEQETATVVPVDITNRRVGVCTRLIETIVLRLSNTTVEATASPVVFTRFSLFTRENTMQEILMMYRDDTVPSNYYNGTKDTKIIIHGFLGSATNDWVVTLRNVLLQWEDLNVITVDWSGAASSPYPIAVANTATVGKQTARLVNILIGKGGDPSKFHIIGHSLGSHVAGFAGKNIKGLGRITGLDPAGPLLVDKPPNRRLDRSDAVFVDNIHTDKECLGVVIPIGDLDFYPNRGTEQPGCAVIETRRSDSIGGVLGALDASFCSHFRAIKLFTESIMLSPTFNSTNYGSYVNEGCQFIGTLCDSYEQFEEGQCSPGLPDDKKFALMGIHADNYPSPKEDDKPRKFYLKTNDMKPYCIP